MHADLAACKMLHTYSLTLLIVSRQLVLQPWPHVEDQITSQGLQLNLGFQLTQPQAHNCCTSRTECDRQGTSSVASLIPPKQSWWPQPVSNFGLWPSASTSKSSLHRLDTAACIHFHFLMVRIVSQDTAAINQVQADMLWPWAGPSCCISVSKAVLTYNACMSYNCLHWFRHCP